MSTAGILPAYITKPTFLGELKQALLLFDKTGIPLLSGIYDVLKQPSSREELRYLINELELLESKGYVFDAWMKSGTPLRRDIDFKAFSEEFDLLSKLIQQVNDIQLSYEAGARHCALILNNQLQKPDFLSVPLVKKFALPAENMASRSDILRVIIDNVPIPDEQTPWEKVIEFKSNSDNVGRFAGLKVWIHKTVASKNTIQEAKDELEYLLYQYRKSLELHKIMHNQGVLQSVIVGTAEILENALRLKFSNIAKGFFSAQVSKADLLSLELNSAGKEVAYIYQAESAFS